MGEQINCLPLLGVIFVFLLVVIKDYQKNSKIATQKQLKLI